MENKVHNLDDVLEYFDFTLFGNTYRFTHMTAEEMEEFRKVSTKTPEKAVEFLIKLIANVEEGKPTFSEIYMKMKPPHIKKFNNMILTEFNG